MSKSVLVLGVSGMAGHMVASYLHERGYAVTGASREPPESVPFPVQAIDLASPAGIAALVSGLAVDIVVNCVGILPKEATADPSRAVLLNAYLPQFLAARLAHRDTRLVHLSTDCVFSGLNPPYVEAAFRDGDTVYDRSKALGEFQSQKDLVLRQSIIGPELRANGTGLLHWFLQQSGSVPGFVNATWNGVTTLTLARGIEAAIEQRLSGLYQLVSPAPITKHDLLGLFAQVFRTGVTVREARMEVTLDKSLRNTRTDFVFEVPSLGDQMRELAKWMLAHRATYSLYERIGWEQLPRSTSAN